MQKHFVSSRLVLSLSGACLLFLLGLTATAYKAAGAQGQLPVVRAVSLGIATLAPTTILSDGSAQAELTVSVTTSVQVLNGTVARVELTEVDNPSDVDYSVSGGNVQGSNGHAWDVTLRGGGVSERIKFKITGQAASSAGSVPFKVSIRSATNPPNATPPNATLEAPTSITTGLVLTFVSPPGGGGGGGPENECPPSDFPGDIYYQTCTPILIDMLKNGFALTDAEGGVDFDMNSDGVKGRISWTAAASDDAFLVLDRNGDGRITLGAELFGYWTPQPASPERHGFLALAEFDKRENGGNGDGVINAADEVFARLRLWQDGNHNGVSEAGELRTLPAAGLRKLELRYEESKRTDEHGNAFRYRAKVWGTRDSKPGGWARDVFLVPAQ